MSSDDELPDIPYCPKPAKRLRTNDEDVFLDLQHKYYQLLAKTPTQRSHEEKTEINKLKKKYFKLKNKFPHLAEEQPTSTDAEHKAKTYMDARRITDIFSGKQIVPEFNDTDDSIGRLGDQICPGCDALHWSRETSQTCCGWRCACLKGKFNCNCDTMCNFPDRRVNESCCGLKVSLPPFPPLPQELHNLWFEDSYEAKLFKTNSRSFNNALALSSIKVRERRFQHNFCPSVIFEGKVFQYSGPLQAEDGEDPKFAQLYIKDPALETTHRQANMSLPGSMSQRD